MTTMKNRTVLRRVLAASAALGLLVAAGCGDDDDDAASTDDAGATETTAADSGDTGGDAGGAGVPYTVDGLQYSDVSAPAGGTIEITNSSGAPHTFTADDGAFDVSYGPDESASVPVPAEAGEYAFHCNIHASMQATLTVE
jgi:plastocyanin